MKKFALLAVVLALVITGCTTDPGTDTPIVPGPSVKGVYVLNEGLWGQDNSTLTRYDLATGTVAQDVFRAVNPGLRLGDTGNFLVKHGDRVFVVMTGSQTVEIFSADSAKWVARIYLGEGLSPRRMAFANDTLAFVTAMNTDEVIRVNPATQKVLGKVKVGPAPEGVAVVNGKVYVVNSGMGDLRKDEPLAGTLSVLSLDGTVVGNIPAGPNPQVVLGDEGRSRLYVLYSHFYSQPDSSGGLIVYDAGSWKELRRYRIPRSPSDLDIDYTSRVAYVLSGEGLWKIDLDTGKQEVLVPSASYNEFGLYALGVNPKGGDIFVSDPRDYVTPGRVLVFSPTGTLKTKFPAGVNPGAFVFY